MLRQGETSPGPPSGPRPRPTSPTSAGALSSQLQEMMVTAFLVSQKVKISSIILVNTKY